MTDNSRGAEMDNKLDRVAWIESTCRKYFGLSDDDEVTQEMIDEFNKSFSEFVRKQAEEWRERG